MINIENTINTISTAFKDVSRPSSDAMFSKYTAPSDLQKAKHIYLEQDKCKLTIDQMNHNNDLIFFMTQEAFVYFLPRIMELCLLNPKTTLDMTYIIMDIFSVESHNQKYNSERKPKIEQLMTPIRQDAVLKFLDAWESLRPGALIRDELWLSRLT